MRSIKGREPDRRCFLTYDRLVVDDNVYIFNDLEVYMYDVQVRVVYSRCVKRGNMYFSPSYRGG